MGGGKTYSQLSAASLAAPKNAALAVTVSTVYKGETLRSMLLNAYGWWKISQLTYIAALTAFALGSLTLIGSLFGLAAGRRTRTSPRPSRRPGRPPPRWSPRADHPGHDSTLAQHHPQLPPASAHQGAGRSFLIHDSGRHGRRAVGLGFHVMRWPAPPCTISQGTRPHRVRRSCGKTCMSSPGRAYRLTTT